VISVIHHSNMNNYTINNDGEFESDDPSLPYGADLIQL